MSDLKTELTALLNGFGIDRDLRTLDYVLAAHLINALDAFVESPEGREALDPSDLSNHDDGCRAWKTWDRGDCDCVLQPKECDPRECDPECPGPEESATPFADAFKEHVEAGRDKWIEWLLGPLFYGPHKVQPRSILSFMDEGEAAYRPIATFDEELDANVEAVEETVRTIKDAPSGGTITREEARAAIRRVDADKQQEEHDMAISDEKRKQMHSDLNELIDKYLCSAAALLAKEDIAVKRAGDEEEHDDECEPMDADEMKVIAREYRQCRAFGGETSGEEHAAWYAGAAVYEVGAALLAHLECMANPDAAEQTTFNAASNAVDGMYVECGSCGGLTPSADPGDDLCPGCGMVVCQSCVDVFEHVEDGAHGSGDPAGAVCELRTRIEELESVVAEDVAREPVIKSERLHADARAKQWNEDRAALKAMVECWGEGTIAALVPGLARELEHEVGGE